MKRFYYTATVERTVIDIINICVEAKTRNESYEIAAKAVEQFPEPVDGDSVKHMYIDNRDNQSCKLVSLDRKIPVDE